MEQRSTYIMVHPGRKISSASLYLHQVRERRGVEEGSLFVARTADFPAVVDVVEQPREGGGSGFFTSLNYMVAVSLPRPPDNAVGHIGQGGISRGLHNGESWLQRRRAEGAEGAAAAEEAD